MGSTASPCMASAGDPAATTPSAASAATVSAERFQTRTRCPALMRLRTMALPIAPRPMKPTSIRKPPCSCCNASGGDEVLQRRRQPFLRDRKNGGAGGPDQAGVDALAGVERRDGGAVER